MRNSWIRKQGFEDVGVKIGRNKCDGGGGIARMRTNQATSNCSFPTIASLPKSCTTNSIADKTFPQ